MARTFHRSPRIPVLFLAFLFSVLFYSNSNSGYPSKSIQEAISFQNDFQKEASNDPITKWKKCVHSFQQRTLNLLSDKINGGIPRKPVILVDPAYHGNVGDNLLSYGELVFLENFTNDHDECGVIQSRGLNDNCRNFTKFANNTLALWHAGGNWGDLWNMQSFRIKTFIPMLQKNMTIISMPQSLYYTHKDRGPEESDQLRKIIEDTIGIENAKRQIVFTWRQEDSYQQALQLYPYVDNRLVPDIAFMIGPIKNSNDWLKASTSIVDLLFLLRDDQESIIKDQRKDKIIQDLINEIRRSEKNITFRIVDWDDREKMYIPNPGVTPMQQVRNRGAFDYNSRISSAVALLSSGRIVVTDRLHASIFAFLSFKPHVIIDQMYRKIERTRDVAFNSSTECQDGKALMYEQSVNLKDAVGKAINMLDKYKDYIAL